MVLLVRSVIGCFECRICLRFDSYRLFLGAKAYRESQQEEYSEGRHEPVRYRIFVVRAAASFLDDLRHLDGLPYDLGNTSLDNVRVERDPI